MEPLREHPPANGRVILTTDGVYLEDILLPEPRLAEWLASVNEDDRVTELVSLMRLGLAMKMNNQMQSLNESLKATADATLNELAERLKGTFQQLDAKLQMSQTTIDHVLSQAVTGDHSLLRQQFQKALTELQQGLKQSQLELVRALDPRQTESIGAQLEGRLKEHMRQIVDGAVVPKMSGLAETLARLEEAIRSQGQLQWAKQRGTQKGTDYEWELLEAIKTYALPHTMLIRRVADEKGVNGSKDGDLVISYNETTLVTIECKDAQKSDIKQLQSAIQGRQAQIGIMAHRHPGGATQSMDQGSVRIAGDRQILLVWDPDEDHPAILSATIGLAVLLAQQLATMENRQPTDVLDLDKAQNLLNQLLDRLETASDIGHHFQLIVQNAEKGKQKLDKMKAEWEKELRKLLTILGGD